MDHQNPFKSPVAPLVDHEEISSVKDIEKLEVSETWKKRFRAMYKAGGPAMPHLKTLSKEERKTLTGFNFLAFFLGPIYYLSKGMWKRAITITAICLVTIFLIDIILTLIGWGKIAHGIRYGVGAFYAVMANIHYYKKMVMHDNGWW